MSSTETIDFVSNPTSPRPQYVLVRVHLIQSWMRKPACAYSRQTTKSKHFLGSIVLFFTTIILIVNLVSHHLGQMLPLIPALRTAHSATHYIDATCSPPKPSLFHGLGYSATQTQTRSQFHIERLPQHPEHPAAAYQHFTLQSPNASRKCPHRKPLRTSAVPTA